MSIPPRQRQHPAADEPVGPAAQLMEEACRAVAVCAERLARVSGTTVRLAILRGKEPAVVLKWVHDLRGATDALRDALEEVRDLQKRST